jgi:hypothetical protein
VGEGDAYAQKAALDADTKVELFRDRKAAQTRQKTLLAALVRVREAVDRVRPSGQSLPFEQVRPTVNFEQLSVRLRNSPRTELIEEERNAR